MTDKYYWEYPEKVSCKISSIGLNHDDNIVIANGKKFKVDKRDFDVIKQIKSGPDQNHYLQINGRLA